MVTIGIIGVGFVGEHLLDTFRRKYNVIGYDVSDQRISELLKKYSTFGNVTIQNSKEGLEKCSLFCVSVPTLIDDNCNTDMAHLERAIDLLNTIAKPESVIVLESSVSVGMTRKLLSHFREKNIYIGFSPERVDPGRTSPEYREIPKIISGIDKPSLYQIKKIYEQVFDKLVIVSNTETAEMCKLYENCFRMVNIAYTNEVTDECEKWNINPHEMIDACSTKPYGFMPFQLGLGIGGHCIPVNPYWMSSNNNVPFLLEATKISAKRPIQKALSLLKNFPNVKKVLVVGVAFKSGEKLTTYSAGLAFARELKNHDIDITLFDPLVDENDKSLCGFMLLKSQNWTPEYINSHYDIVCISIKQQDVEWKILDHVTAKIIKFCRI